MGRARHRARIELAHPWKPVAAVSRTAGRYRDGVRCRTSRRAPKRIGLAGLVTNAVQLASLHLNQFIPHLRHRLMKSRCIAIGSRYALRDANGINDLGERDRLRRSLKPKASVGTSQAANQPGRTKLWRICTRNWFGTLCSSAIARAETRSPSRYRDAIANIARRHSEL